MGFSGRSGSGGLTRSVTGSFRGFDRFIPSRSDSSDKFRMGKAPCELTRSEMLLRHGSDTEDAFCYRRRTVTPMAADYRSPSQSESMPSGIRFGTVLGPLDQNSGGSPGGQVSRGTIWAVGGVLPIGTAVDNGRGRLVRSGTNARLFRTALPTAKPKAEEEREKHEARIAVALGMDRAHRVLETKVPHQRGENFKAKEKNAPTQWNGTEWVKDGPPSKSSKPLGFRELPTVPFKMLGAPGLRDDFNCTVLAYSITCGTLAVGLGDLLYGWSESGGVRLLSSATSDPDCHLTSVAFSSSEGRKCILAYARTDRTLSLMSLLDDLEEPSSGPSPLPRFEILQPASVRCLSWKPTCTPRPSMGRAHPGAAANNEDLLVGDEAGHVYYYGIEWPHRWEVERDNWTGKISLLARITAHSQQICGLSWSRDGDLFATGGNDSTCCLFETSNILDTGTRPAPVTRAARTATEIRQDQQEIPQSPLAGPTESGEASDLPTEYDSINIATSTKELGFGDEKYRWLHRSAVKAIAFCPWQDGLVATGGGSNDKCIHFFHTTSGAPLATIPVSAQVTSLIWSTTSREIAATFDYAQPKHQVRIAVFSWPDCRQVAAIPWVGEHRALYAIPYPGGPKDASLTRSGTKLPSCSRPLMEGCIMVASSDKTVKFHEVWATDTKAAAGGAGMLGGSEILESLKGIDRDADVIR